MTRLIGLSALLVFILVLAVQAQPWMERFDGWDRQPTTQEIFDAFDDYWDGREPTKGSGYKQFMRWRHFVDFRLDENGQFHGDKLWEGWEQKQRLFPDSELDEANWEPLGPFTPIAGSYVGGLGRVNCLAQDPTDANHIYAGAASGGLWVTFTGGYSWSPLTDHLPVLGVAHIEIDPSNPDVLYMATGDADGQDTYSIGVLKSTDAGSTWNPTGLSYDVTDGVRISKVMLVPGDSQTLLAASSHGIYKSVDAGDTWTLVQPTNGFFHDMEVHATNPDIWFAAASGNGVYRSTDRGDSWTRLSSGLPGQGGGLGRIAIDTTPANPDNVYALYSNNNNGFYGLYRSYDGGDTWLMMSNSPNILSSSESGSGSGGQAWYDLTLETDPNNADLVYVGGVNVWKSYSGGLNWQLTGLWYYSGAGPYIHADHHRMENFVDPDGNDVLFSANDGGVYRSYDQGDNWEEISAGMVIQQMYRIGVYQNTPEVEMIMFGNQDNGTKLKDGDEFTAVMGGDGFESAIDPTTSQYMYAEVYYGQLGRSSNGGQSFSNATTGIGEQGAWLTPYVIDQNNPETLWYGTRYIYRSDNRAASWSRMSPSAGGSYYDNMTAIAVAPNNSDVVYGLNPNGALLYTTDGGSTWEFSNTPASYPSNPGTYVAVSPFNDSIVYVTTGGYQEDQKVFVSVDRGETWENLSAGLPNVPATCIAIHPYDGNQVYLGTDTGVFYSDDAGETWQSWDNNLPNVIISELEFHTNSNTLVAGTYGRGIWASEAEPANVDPFITLVAPNGGEEWVIGSTENIRWSSFGVDSNVAIEINRNYPDGAWETLFAATENDWTETWVVDGEASENVRFRVTAVDEPTITDQSDGDMSLVQPDITIVQPNGGEVLPLLMPYTIQWTTTAVEGNLDLELNRDYPNGDWETIVNGIPDVGSLTWIANGDGSQHARFRIRSQELEGVEDISDGDFSILNVPAITLNSPNANVTWTMGEQAGINWRDNFAEDVLIELVDAEETAYSITTVESPDAGDNAVQIVVDGDMPPGESYTLRISKVDDATVSDVSESTIQVELAVPELAFPGDGDTINGDPAIFTWQPVAGASSYSWILASSPDLENDMLATIDGITDTSYTTSFSENETLYWSVVAHAANDYATDPADPQEFTVDVTSVAEMNFSGMPEVFDLAGIYPNPFNPVTQIVVALPKAAELNVTVYNTTGQKVATLARGQYPAGYQRLTFGGETLASGAYFVHVSSPGELDITRKMLLVR